jgi:hypothetical protein
MTMTPEEIRAEVGRKVQRAKDLKIRETLWKLKKSFDHVRAYARANPKLDEDFVKQDPAFGAKLMYPGVKLLDDGAQFPLGNDNYEIRYAEGGKSHDRYGRADFETTDCVLALKSNGQPVFGFKVQETVEFGPDMPTFRESLGEIVRFIEGSWVTEITDFAKMVEEHTQRVWKERNAPKEAKEIEDLRKRFGI